MNSPDVRRIMLFAAVLAPATLFPMACTAQPNPATYRWVELPGDYLELEYNGQPVVRYMHEAYDDSSPDALERTYKPFHHVYSPDGTLLLTKGPDGLYTHHRGLFYGFSQVTYGDDQQCDIWHCHEGAHQLHVESITTGAYSDGAYHVAAIDWHGQDGEVFAQERRGLAIDVRPAGVQIDFLSRLASSDGQPIHLDGDPQHAGFHFRGSQEVAEGTKGETYFLRTDGRGELVETRNWEGGGEPAMNAECENRPWNAMSFVVDDRRYTALYLDHPNNPKPSRYSEREYGRFGSYFVADVSAERPLEVRYRLWIQEGEMTVDQCDAMWERFQTSVNPISAWRMNEDSEVGDWPAAPPLAACPGEVRFQRCRILTPCRPLRQMFGTAR